MGYTQAGGPHLFHIPIMGTGFTIDTPVRIARYGLNSVMSIGDDILMEQMREYYCKQLDRSFTGIPDSEIDRRALRITAYLNLIREMVADSVEKLKTSPFEPKSEITRYFEMLPDLDLKQSYKDMLSTTDPVRKAELQKELRLKAVPGDIDVNIMTKVDRDQYLRGEKLPPEYAAAMAGLRGFAKSDLTSSIIFSAGINRRVYSYISSFEDFFPDEDGRFRKRVILKVSDFRSAKVQGKFLAKKGIWVSEYRIESGINCGGHAFLADGQLMGPILEEIRLRRKEWAEELGEMYSNALGSLDRRPAADLSMKFTVQGGIGTAEENRLMFDRYKVDGTGWATPFLLVPEVTNVDDAHLKKLSEAGDDDVYLSNCSPLGIPFWALRNTASEQTRIKRAEAGRPGSPCPKGFLVSNTDYTDVPICRASRKYQKLKLDHISSNGTAPDHLQEHVDDVLARTCLCEDLAGSVLIKLGINPGAQTSVCCGPNIANFSKIATLEEMIDHIYGRISLLTNPDRPHMFLRELALNIDYMRSELKKVSEGLSEMTSRRLDRYQENILTGIEHYRQLADEFSAEQKERFLEELKVLHNDLNDLFSPLNSLQTV